MGGQRFQQRSGQGGRDEAVQGTQTESFDSSVAANDLSLLSMGFVAGGVSASDQAFGSTNVESGSIPEPAVESGGDERAVVDPTKWSAKAIGKIQEMLECLGVYFGVTGTLTEDTKKALTETLSSTNWSKLSADEVLKQLDALRTATIEEARTTEASTGATEKDLNLRVALAGANQDLQEWIAKRSKSIAYPTLLGPTMDATYFYRLGNEGTDGFGLKPDQLEAARQRLTSQGFPRLNDQELRLVNFTNYAGRRQALPDRRFTAKHFPGGDESLEVTETQAVHFANPEAIRVWVENYRRLIAAGRPPELIMLSHATYDPRGFPGLELEGGNGAPYSSMPFDKLPASLNPAIVSYLRKHLGFQGLVIADWFDMHSIKRFTEQHMDWNFSTREVQVYWAATVAGVDYVLGSTPDPEDLARELEGLRGGKTKSAYKKLMEAQDQSLVRIWNQIAPKAGRPELQLHAISLAEKILFRTHNAKLGLSAEAWRSRLQPKSPEVFDIFMRNAVGDFDIWNRTGVMTMIQRQRVVERLTGKRFAALPRNTPDESRWFRDLHRNPEFMKAYREIQWDSPEIRQQFTDLFEQRFPETAK